MRRGSKQTPYNITVKFANGMTRTVTVKAASREVAEKRALKRNPSAEGIQRGNQ